MATFVLQAITGAHTPTCLLSRNRSRRNRDAPKPSSASRANWLVLLVPFYACCNFAEECRAAYAGQSHEQRLRSWMGVAPPRRGGLLLFGRLTPIASAAADFIRGYFRSLPTGRKGRFRPVDASSRIKWANEVRACDCPGAGIRFQGWKSSSVEGCGIPPIPQNARNGWGTRPSYALKSA